MSAAANISNYVDAVSPWTDWAHIAYYTIDGTPVDLTGYTARAALRSTVRNQLIASFTVGSGITISAVLGKVILSVTPAITALLDGRKDVLVDLDLIHPNGTVIPFYFANLVVKPKATQVLP